MNTQMVILRKADTEIETFAEMVKAAHDSGVEVFALDIEADRNELFAATAGYKKAIFVDFHPTSNAGIAADRVLSLLMGEGIYTVVIRISGQTYRDGLIDDFAGRIGAHVLKYPMRFIICASGRALLSPKSSANRFFKKLDTYFRGEVIVSPIVNYTDTNEAVLEKLKHIAKMVSGTPWNKVSTTLAAYGTDFPLVKVSEFLAVADVTFISLTAWATITKNNKPTGRVIPNREKTIDPIQKVFKGEILRPSWVKNAPFIHADNVRRIYPSEVITFEELYCPENGVQFGRIRSGEWMLVSDQGFEYIKILE